MQESTSFHSWSYIWPSDKILLWVFIVLKYFMSIIYSLWKLTSQIQNITYGSVHAHKCVHRYTKDTHTRAYISTTHNMLQSAWTYPGWQPCLFLLLQALGIFPSNNKVLANTAKAAYQSAQVIPHCSSPHLYKKPVFSLFGFSVELLVPFKFYPKLFSDFSWIV